MTANLLPACALESPKNDIQRVIRLVLWHAEPLRIQTDRRRERRHPYPYPIRMTPVAANGRTSPSDAIVVLGKHLSPSGLDFYYREPLPYRQVVASFDCDGEEMVNILMKLTWCRFGRYGWYENGGRFVEALPFDVPEAD